MFFPSFSYAWSMHALGWFVGFWECHDESWFVWPYDITDSVFKLFKPRNVRSVADNSVRVCVRFALKAGVWKSLKRVSNNHKKNWQLEVACVYNHIFYDLFYDIFFTCSFLCEAIRSCCFCAWTSTRSTRWHETKGGNRCELSVLNKQDGKSEKGKKQMPRWSKKKYDGMSCFFKVTLDHIDPESGKKLGEGFVGCMPWNFKMSIPEHSDRNVMKPRHLKRWHVWELESMWLFLPETLDGISDVVCQELQGWISDDQRALTHKTKGMGIYEWNIDRMKIRSSLCLHFNGCFFVHTLFSYIFLQSLLV